jgi:hypothetical protein
MTHPVPDKLLLEAIDRIARTPDGRMQYLYLQRVLMALPASDAPCALSTNYGERRFAARLLGLMATGISESGERSSHDGTSSDPGGAAEQPIVVPVPQPVDTRVSRGAGRRITADTRVPGYDYPADEPTGQA